MKLSLPFFRSQMMKNCKIPSHLTIADKRQRPTAQAWAFEVCFKNRFSPLTESHPKAVGQLAESGHTAIQDNRLECNLFYLLLRFFLLCLLVYLTHNVTRLGIWCIHAVVHLKEFLQVLQNTCRNHFLCSPGCRLLLWVPGGTDTKTCRLYANPQFVDAKCNFKMWSNIQS